MCITITTIYGILYRMARPTKKEAVVIENRNVLIIYAYTILGISQANIARIFRLPRNTVSHVVKTL